MLKKIKKLYFKIYHLFKFLGLFILIFGLNKYVYAEVVDVESMPTEECSSNNLLKSRSYGDASGFDGNSNNLTYEYNVNTQKIETKYTNYAWIYKKKIIVEKNTTYKTGVNQYQRIIIIDENYNYINTVNSAYEQAVSFTTPNEGNYYYILYAVAHTRYSTIGTTYIVKNTIENNFDTFVETECPQNNPNPPVSDEVYSSFISLYIEKIQYLTEGFTSNPYLLAMIGIIFAWVVLELFLRILHLKGGYKK